MNINSQSVISSQEVKMAKIDRETTMLEKLQIKLQVKEQGEI